MNACDIFPMLGESEFEALKRDIAEHGQREPILLVDGEVVDGRNRMRACDELGIDPVVRNMSAEEAGDVFTLVMSLNYHRRHLRPHEKGAAMQAYMDRVGAKKQERKRTDCTGTGAVPEAPTVKDAARSLGIAEQTARDHLKAAKDYEAAAPEHRAKVDAGQMTPKQARAATALDLEGDQAMSETEKNPGKRKQLVDNAAARRAAEIVGRIESVSVMCARVKVEVVRRDERLLRHFTEACRSAQASLRSLVREMEC